MTGLNLSESIETNTKCRVRLIVHKTSATKYSKFETIRSDIFYDGIMSGYDKLQRPVEDWVKECIDDMTIDEDVNEILEKYQDDDFVEILGTFHSKDTSHDTDCGWEYDSVEWLEDVQHALVGEAMKECIEASIKEDNEDLASEMK